MKRILNITTFLFFSCTFCISGIFAQCTISASVYPPQIYCGQSATLTAFGIGEGTIILSENFNSGFGTGWSSTPGSVNFSNPCSPNGVDGTPHAWMDNNTSVPRQLVSASYNLTTATAGVTICFDLKFAKQGEDAPCEGPDEPDEGVYLQYSTNGGASWITIHYFHPYGGKDAQLINWNKWCFQVPPEAITSTTSFRWFQDNDSGKDYDHWGIDNVQIVQNDVNAEVVWGASSDSYHYSYGIGNSGGDHPNTVSPQTTTTYNVKITTGLGQECSTSVTLAVLDPVYEVSVTSDPNPICMDACADIVGTAVQVLDSGGQKTFDNSETALLSGLPSSLSELLDLFITVPCISFSGCPCPCGGSVSLGQQCDCPKIFPTTMSMNINAEPLNALTVADGELLSICIDNANLLSGNFNIFSVSLVCPGGASVLLADVGDLVGTTLSNVCFSMSGSNVISSGTAPYSGTWLPVGDFSDLASCNPNGVWTLEFSGVFDWTNGPPSDLPVGIFSGWSFVFDDPPIHDTITNGSWSPAAVFSDPTQISTQICPTSLGSSSYDLTISNGVMGCATHTETVTFTVSSCTNECTPPNLTVSDLSICEPSSLDLSTAINANDQGATLSYYMEESDAQSGINSIESTAIYASGTYWIRAESPSDGNCYSVVSVVATIFPNSTPIITGSLTYCGILGTTLDAGDGYSSYLWSNGQTTQTITSLATTNEGVFVTVTTSDGCTASSDPVVIIVHNLSINRTTSQPSCGQANGTITITASGGDGNYTFQLNSDPPIPFTSPHTITDLPPGIYAIGITDGSGCSKGLLASLTNTNFLRAYFRS